MRHFFLLAVATLSLGLAGCSASEAPMSKDQENRLRNPSKEVPPEAAEAMRNMGDAVKRQQEANKAAGVDDRGRPIQPGAGN